MTDHAPTQPTELGARDLPPPPDADHPLSAHSLADEHIFGHVRLGPSSTWICGVCDDAGERVSVVPKITHDGPAWTHVRAA